MKWSWRLGTFAGIDVYMHATFVLLIGWIALSHWLKGQNLAATLAGVAFVLALFVCVILHEYGHALMARRFGISASGLTSDCGTRLSSFSSPAMPAAEVRKSAG